MTVCIAGINHSNPWPMIVAACDRKLSFFGGWSSSEGVAVKISGLNKNWTIMFSGDVSPMTALIDAMKQRTEKLRPMDYRAFARLCRTVYREERKPLIESEVLTDYDIDSYAEYMALRKSEPELHTAIKQKIKLVEDDWNLLFAGFDNQGDAHIFTIMASGKIDFHDRVGYAAIGEGALRALLALGAYPFDRYCALSEALFGIAAAKFSAEAANGVGDETILTILERNAKVSGVLPTGLIPKLRKMWRELPRFPGTSAQEAIWKELHMLQERGWLRNPRPRSKSRRLKGSQ